MPNKVLNHLIKLWNVCYAGTFYAFYVSSRQWQRGTTSEVYGGKCSPPTRRRNYI